MAAKSLIGTLEELQEYYNGKAADLCENSDLPCEYTRYDLECAKEYAIQEALKRVRAWAKDRLADSDPLHNYIQSDMEITEAAVIQAGRKLQQSYPVTNADRAEFIGQIIDGFEAFLDQKGVTFLPEQEPDESVKLAGADYDALKTFLEDTMRNWRVIE